MNLPVGTHPQRQTVARQYLHALADQALAITDPARRAHLAELVDAAVSSPANLKAGWVPDDSLGTCGTWVSSPTQLWVLDAS